MQFVTSLLTIPISVQQLTVKANLQYFVDLLSTAQVCQPALQLNESLETRVQRHFQASEFLYVTATHTDKAQFLSVGAAGLIDFVNTASFTPNMTFFVPNSAESLAKFKNISAGISADDLEALFYYHIVPDFVGYSNELTNGTVLKTYQGSNITITRDASNIYVNDAMITIPDYLVVNGVIHVIDR
jgi:uncharacterized surface protein with fasciclin (FAS1) repeats